MVIWSAEIKELEKLHESLKGQLPDLEKELEQLTRTEDANVVMLYSRRCLEVIITDLCECELKRPRKTEPLKGIIDKLHKEDKVPSHIITSMHGLNELSTYGAHPKDFDPEQVKPVLVNLDIIVKWYLKYKNLQVKLKEDQGKKNFAEQKTGVPSDIPSKPQRNLLLIFTSIFLIVLIIVVPKISKNNTLERLKSSGKKITIAIMPFHNMTGDASLSNWQDDIQYNMIVYLSNFREELTIRERESIANILHSNGLSDYNSITTSEAGSVSEKLDADIFIDGSVNKSGSIIRINAQLVDSKTRDVLKPFQIDGTVEDKFVLIDSLSVMVKNVLIISELEKELTPDFFRFTSVSSPESFRYFISGLKAFNDRDWATAENLFSQAITLDSNFTFAVHQMVFALNNQGLYDEAKTYALKLYKKRDQMPIRHKILADYIYDMMFETPYDEIRDLKQGLEFDDQLPSCYFGIGLAYWRLDQFEKAIPEYEKALNIYDKWGVKPMWTGCYSHLGFLYHKTKNYEKEKELYKKAEIAFPDNSDLVQGQATLSLSEGDKDAANRFINKYISIREEKSVSEASIINGIAEIYSNAGFFEKAEEYYRQALSLEPENPARMNTLAYFLIDKDRNKNEGLEFVNKALELNPEDYEYLHTKGWGLFKQGKSREASDILQKSWDTRREKAVYDHEALLHLEAAKKAVAGQN
jgi:tetratricopeptide (TPR) repeat protein